MLGILFVLFSVACQEVGISIGKRESERHHVIYSLGVLNMLFGALFMLASGFFSADGFRFAAAALPTMALRGVLEVFQAYASVKAMVLADRTTLGFLQVITIPLLLAADMLLGFPVSGLQFAGIALTVMALIFLFVNHGIGRKGAWWCVISAVNAAVTISLYKYHIANYNSVAFEQAWFLFLLAAFYMVMAWKVERANPFVLLRTPKYLVASLAIGFGMIFVSFAYLLLPASVATTAKRSFTVLSTIVSGRTVFKEKGLVVKLAAFFMITAGLILLAAATR